MNINEILHILRNPYGYSHQRVRAACLAAADEIERLHSSPSQGYQPVADGATRPARPPKEE